MFTIAIYSLEGRVEMPCGFAHRSTALDAAFAAIDMGRYSTVGVYENGVKVGQCNVHGWHPMNDSIIPQPLKETMSITRSDLAKLDSCRKTVRELEAREREAHAAVLAVLKNAGIDDATPGTVHALIKHADDVRDVLEPFDSGTRCATPVPPSSATVWGAAPTFVPGVTPAPGSVA